jgi:Homeodomain-like domain
MQVQNHSRPTTFSASRNAETRCNRTVFGRFAPKRNPRFQGHTIGDTIVTTHMQGLPPRLSHTEFGTAPYTGKMAAEAAIAEEVLMLHSDGWSIRAIAKRLGLSRMATHRIIAAARPAELAEPGEIGATVARLRRHVQRLDDAANRGHGVRLGCSDAREIAAVLRREIAGLIGA